MRIILDGSVRNRATAKRGDVDAALAWCLGVQFQGYRQSGVAQCQTRQLMDTVGRRRNFNQLKRD